MLYRGAGPRDRLEVKGQRPPCHTACSLTRRPPDYPVRSFNGRKRMILSTISWMGGKNPFLGVAYITVGGVCFFLGVVLLIIHHQYGSRNNSADISN